MKLCLRPHFQHLFTFRVENLGFFFALANTDFFAIKFICYLIFYQTSQIYSPPNPAFFASAPGINPLEVETIANP